MARGELSRVSMESDVVLGILAGGAGRRFGGRDKGWVEVADEAQIVRLLAHWRDRVGRIVISANRTLAAYRALGVEVISDHWPDFPGPLAGIVGLLGSAAGERVLTLPVDLVDWPDDLLPRLQDALAGCDVAVAVDDDGLQPLIACYRPGLDLAAAAAFDAGERSVQRWQAGLRQQQVRFDAFRFGNRNTPDAC